MKIISTIPLVFTFGLVACSQNLRVMWDPHATADDDGLTYYTVYKWEGDSSEVAMWDLSQMDSIGILPHVLNFVGPYEFQTYFSEDKIIRAGCVANDSLGRKSNMVLSKFYDRPGDMTKVWLED